MQSLLIILSHCLFISSLSIMTLWLMYSNASWSGSFCSNLSIWIMILSEMHYNAWPNTYNRFLSLQPEAPCSFLLLPIKYVSKLNLRGIYKIMAIIWNKQVRKEKNLLCSCDFATMNESWCKKSFCDKVSASLINCTWSTYLGYHLSSSTLL